MLFAVRLSYFVQYRR